MATKPLSDLTATWNASGTTFSAIKMNVTDTASAAGSALLDLQVGGVSQFKISKAGAVTAVGVAIPTISSSDTLSNKTLSSPTLSGTVAGTPIFAQEITATAYLASGTNYNGFRFYNSTGAANEKYTTLYTDVGSVRWAFENDARNSATSFLEVNRSGITPTAINLRATVEVRDGTNAQAFRVYNTFTDASNYERAAVSWSGNVLSLGMEKAGTGSFRQVTIGGSIIQFNISGTDVWRFGAANQFIPNNTNNYDIGSTSNVVRNFYAGTAYILADGVTAPTATVGFAKIYIDTADGDLKIIFGDGTIKTIVTDT